jgi:hypothetical protein
MKKHLINLAYGMYLGFTLSTLFDAQWYEWKYYVVMIPTIILAEMKVNNKDEVD